MTASYSNTQRMTTLAMLAEIERWCDGGSDCGKTGRELAGLLRIGETTAYNAIELLEAVGAIRCERDGRVKRIALASPGGPAPETLGRASLSN